MVINQTLKRVDISGLLDPIEIRVLDERKGASNDNAAKISDISRKDGYEHLIEEGLLLEEQNDFSSAFKCFKEASLHDLPLGHLFTGLLLRHGIGAVKDEKSGYGHLIRAAVILMKELKLSKEENLNENQANPNLEGVWDASNDDAQQCFRCAVAGSKGLSQQGN